MKKILLMAITAIVAFGSCQKDKAVSTPDEVSQRPELEVQQFVEVNLSKDEYGEPVLSFKTQEEMYTQVQNLKLKSETESEQWYSEFNGFVSQNQFMWDVVDELDNAQSIEEVKLTQDKYANLLIFNNNEADRDISPYIPSTSLGNDLICNKYGNVMLNGIIYNFNDITSYSQIKESQGTLLTKLRPGYLANQGAHNKDTHRKFWVRLYKDQTGWVELYLEAQRRVLWGLFYNKYRTSYNLRINSDSGWEKTTSLASPLMDNKGVFKKTKNIPSSQYNRFVYANGRASFSLTVYTDDVGLGLQRTVGYSQQFWSNDI